MDLSRNFVYIFSMKKTIIFISIQGLDIKLCPLKNFPPSATLASIPFLYGRHLIGTYPYLCHINFHLNCHIINFAHYKQHYSMLRHPCYIIIYDNMPHHLRHVFLLDRPTASKPYQVLPVLRGNLNS